jgi:hypothetical protein
VPSLKRLALIPVSVLLINFPSAQAHEGGLDRNGCHYDRSNGNYHCHKEVPPNSDTRAVAKKSRENICHDASSPNYRQLRYFISYRDMDACLASGGLEYRR